MSVARTLRACLACLGLAALAGPASAQMVGDLVQMPEVDWEQRPGATLPADARFVDQDGREVRLGKLLAEGPTVLALVYYECPMLCNLVLDGLVEGLRDVPFEAGADFRVVALSIDPGETADLAERRRARYVEAYGRGTAEGWTFLVGAEDEVRAVADAVGFRYTYVPETDEYAHAAGIVVVTPEGRVSRTLFGVGFAPLDLRLALTDAGDGAIGSVIDQVLLRCFHYDPARGKYGFAILGAIRMAGTATVLLLGAFVVRMLRRERRARADTGHGGGVAGDPLRH